ncbi:MAG: GDSL-type esterase/lipase family protein, partial [Planctomycetales bacterium]
MVTTPTVSLDRRRPACWLLALCAAVATFFPAASQAAGPSLKKNDRVIFLGDSITAAGVRPGGYVTLIRETITKQLPELGVVVSGAGNSGNKVTDLQKRLDRDVISKKPTVVFIYIGINDVWHSLRDRGTKPDAFRSGLLDVIGRINKAGARVILCTPSMIGEKTDGSNQLDKMLD